MSLRSEAVGYRLGERRVLDGVSLNIEPGRVHVLLGPNGAGKSTLLRMLAGDFQPEAGRVELDRRRLGHWPALDLARRRAVMMQREYLPFPFSAGQVVALGRLPWQRPASAPGEQRIILRSLQAAGAERLAARPYPALSGGERARVQLARALAQIDADDGVARYLLLDEPTASLDFAFLHQCLDIVRALAAAGTGVLLILQDPALARRYGDCVSLIGGGRIIAAGAPSAVLTDQAIAGLYGIGVARVQAIMAAADAGAAREPPAVSRL